ncbi:methylated-DNA--[protein]-cysteine S-methyltransferase [Haloarchaeobius amylolyticus]|uniref:methylated-DNA--[protein]-cysteine S-methyltransferase n=1 Tax=Haloarchaeobius amylolyticus TaxID=1198296 RepID=UPI00227102E2|nr:methylated-DNA--[protein]-cysteine S-methyltransferase [Haloarchaeobius amylolyticus]
MHLSVLGGSFTVDETLVDAPPETIREQVAEYGRGERESVDLTVSFPDSFTGEVMREMAAIPLGETRTYGEIAATLDSSPVAVGQACGRNPVPVVVPCHRVVGTDWLGGFSGETEGDRVDLKRRLLEHEGAIPGRQATLSSDF